MEKAQILFGEIDDKVFELERMLEKAETTLNLVLNHYFQVDPKEKDIILGEHHRAGLFTEMTTDIFSSMRKTFLEVNSLLKQSDELEKEESPIAGNDKASDI